MLTAQRDSRRELELSGSLVNGCGSIYVFFEWNRLPENDCAASTTNSNLLTRDFDLGNTLEHERWYFVDSFLNFQDTTKSVARSIDLGGRVKAQPHQIKARL